MTEPGRMGEPVLRRATADELDTSTLYALLRLRMEVFIVEQACPFLELDGRDLEPTTVHYWLTPPGTPATVLGCLRLLRERDGYRIGRVCTARPARGTGLAGVLMRAALAEIGPTVSVLDAQAHLTGFYAAFGYQVAGEQYLEDGILHVPMRRVPTA